MRAYTFQKRKMIRIFIENDRDKLEYVVNEFIKDKHVVDIEYMPIFHHFNFTPIDSKPKDYVEERAMVIYEEFEKIFKGDTLNNEQRDYHRTTINAGFTDGDTDADNDNICTE